MISVRNLTVSLSGKEILHDVSFEVAEGAWLGILGPNGAGKTTLLKAMAGLIPFDGEVLIDGRPLHEWSPQERATRMAMVAQSVPLYFDFTVQDLVLLGRSPHKRWLAPYDGEDRRIAADALRQVDMAGFENRSMLALSGGEQRRALLAQALAQDTRLVILDEPTSHLDVHHQYEFLEHVRTLVDDARTAIGVFHDLELAARFSDRLIVLQDGRIAADGPPAEALTPETLRVVFGMEAEIQTEEDGLLRIYYRAPVGRGNGASDAA